MPWLLVSWRGRLRKAAAGAEGEGAECGRRLSCPGGQQLWEKMGSEMSTSPARRVCCDMQLINVLSFYASRLVKTTTAITTTKTTTTKRLQQQEHMCASTHTHTHTHTHTCARAHARTHARTRAHTRAHTHTHTHSNTHTRTHTHTHEQFQTPTERQQLQTGNTWRGDNLL